MPFSSIADAVEDYVHRAGRTARGAMEGTVSSVATWQDKETIRMVDVPDLRRIPCAEATAEQLGAHRTVDQQHPAFSQQIFNTKVAERGILVTRESVRLWCIKFGARYSRRLKRKHRGYGDTFDY